ncbi:MAG: hypothetical protein IJ419_13860 [Agathobacter sp.]|nr:hypothetical protein [Agathobacter sp.]
MRQRRKTREYVYQNKASLIVYFVLRTLVLISMIRAVIRTDYESVFLCALTLVLMIMPSILSKTLQLELPSTLEIIILLFIFAAEILGEINNFYIKMPYWDTLLHTLNGFLCAAIGFALVDLMNREERFTFQLSPAFLAIVAFCFSMTVSIFWEFFEFVCDTFLSLDMQKDTIIQTINTVNLDATNSNIVVHLQDIKDVVVVYTDGTSETLKLGGYLDIGLIDTMSDLFVNLIGAIVFSIIGYFYVKHKGRGKIASSFIPKIKTKKSLD